MGQKQSDEEITELRRVLREARETYYNLNPIITDQVYDAKKERLKQLIPDDPEVVAVGAEPSKISVWEKVEHRIPMGSLDKVNDENGFREWVADAAADRFTFTHKIDGSSMELVYEQGKLVRCVTRGDGKIGEDVTANVSKIPDIPKEIPITYEDIIVRGEVVMLREVFKQKYAEKYANPRNTAAGKVRDKKGGGIDCENLSFLAFTLVAPTAPDREELRFRILEKMGFKVPEFGSGGIEEVITWHSGIASTREMIPYEIDGTVTRVDDIKLQDGLGELNMRPRGQIAWKFDPATGITKVVDVKWQVGPTGRITPVMEVEPVKIGGVTITSVSLHNLSLFRELRLWKGCKVLISRRNDVIPYCEENLSMLAAEN